MTPPYHLAATTQIASRSLEYASLCHWGKWTLETFRSTSRKTLTESMNHHRYRTGSPVGSHSSRQSSAALSDGRHNNPTDDAQHRRAVKVGLEVDIVLKTDQSTNKLTRGIVQDLLTNSGTHPRGIKVRLRGGAVGRVHSMVLHSKETTSVPLRQDTNPQSKSEASSAFAGLSGLRRQMDASGCEPVTKAAPKQSKDLPVLRESSREDASEAEQAGPSERTRIEGRRSPAVHSHFFSSKSILQMAIDEGFTTESS